MEQVKMSDVFAMPISGNGYYGGFFDSNGELILFSDLEVNQKVSIFKAINDYDQHIGLIAKQSEQIKMLREAIDNALRIKDLWQFANVGENYYEEQDLLNGMKSSLEQALSATEHE